MSKCALFAVILLLQMTSGCASRLLAVHGNTPEEWSSDTLTLLNALRALGIQVERVGEVEQPFLSVTGSMVQVNGEDVQVFAYPSAAKMEAQAARIALDGGTIGTSKIHWIGAPHFFKQGKLLVLYVGENGAIVRDLEAVLGRQFAGKKQ